MKKFIISIVILFSALNITMAQNIGLGFQANFVSNGLSAKYDINQDHTAQLIYGAFGALEMISGRYIYNFDEKNNITPFLYAQAGLWTYKFPSVTVTGVPTDDSESVFGYGLGAGIELTWLSFISDDLKWTLEVGLGLVDFEFYEYKATTFGSGVHYYF